MGDIVLPAGVLVSFTLKALVIAIDAPGFACPGFGGHQRSAITAEQFPAEDIRLVILHRLLSVALLIHQFVTTVKGFGVHDSGNNIRIDRSVVDDDPFVLGVTDDLGKGIDRKRRTGLVPDPHRVQTVNDHLCFLTVAVSFKQIFDDPGFGRIDYPMFVHDVVSEQVIPADEISFCQTFLDTSLYLLRKFGRIVFRHTFEDAFDQDAACVLGNVFFGGEDADAVLFQLGFVVRAVVAVAGKTIQLIDENEIKSLLPAVVDHPQELRTLVGRSRQGTVDIFFHDDQIVTLSVIVTFPQLSLYGLLGLVVRTESRVDDGSFAHNALLV